MAKPMIEVQQLGKEYRLGERASYLALRDVLARGLKQWFKSANVNRFWALADVSFNVQPGEVIGVVGRNGAGKSTLLKILSQITPPTKGRVVMNGKVASLLEVGTGFHPELTGRENIFLNGAILGMSRVEIKKKFDAIVDFSEIEKFIDTPVKHYSSGMYVRLAFAVAAHLEPEILVVDEVLAVGDASFQKKCLGKLSDVVEEGGRTVLFVSHNMGAIQTLCPRSILLHKGKLVDDGPSRTVINTYLETVGGHGDIIYLSERDDRQGNGALRVQQIELWNEHNQPIKQFQSGKTARLAIRYHSSKPQPLTNVAFAIGINNHIGERITNLWTKTLGEDFISLPATGTVVLDIEALPLTESRYYITVFAEVNQEVADWVVDAGSFDVAFGDFYQTGKLIPDGQGSFLMHYHWTQQ